MKSKDLIQKEALDVLLPVHRGGAAIATGGGKTLLGLLHMNANYNEFAKFLVTAPKLAVFTEWKNQAKEHGLAHLLPHITFTTYLSLTEQELEQMKYVIEQGLSEGAFGVSTGLSFSHARLTPFNEILEILKIVKEHNVLYATHLR